MVENSLVVVEGGRIKRKTDIEAAARPPWPRTLSTVCDVFGPCRGEKYATNGRCRRDCRRSRKRVFFPVNDVLRFPVRCWIVDPGFALRGLSPVHRDAIDLAHLNRQTGGDDALAAEVLRLFAAQAPVELVRLRSASASERRKAAHLLVGSARAIGAGEVARLAAEIEAGGKGVDALEAAIVEVIEFIAIHFGPSDSIRTGSAPRNRL
jgi:HPt (histidine-containing phosphotransfer) domain-containing protein